MGKKRPARCGVVSVFDRVELVFVLARSPTYGEAQLPVKLQRWASEGLERHDIEVFYQPSGERARTMAIVEGAGLPIRSSFHENDGSGLIGLMHLAKVREFRAAAIVAFDEGVMQPAELIADMDDEFEMDEVGVAERQLLNVPLT